MKKLFSLLPLVAAFNVGATSYYACDCETGAHASCSPGSNINAGTSTSAPKENFDATDIENAPAGDQFLHCNGGFWNRTASLQLGRNLNATKANPIVISNYAPPTGATGLPIYNFSTSIQGIEVGGFGSGDEGDFHGGYTISNMRLRGNNSGNWGILIWPPARDVIIDNVELTGWNIAVYSLGPPSAGGTSADPLNRYFILRNSTIADNPDMGYLGSGQYFTFESNTFEGNNFTGSGQSHALYFSCEHGDCDGLVIRNNLFDRNSVNVTGPNDSTRGKCTGGNVTAHGIFNQILVEDNTILQDESTSSCFGFSFTQGYVGTDEVFNRAVFRGNTVVNLGTCSFCINSSTNLLIENNLVVHTTDTFHGAFDVIQGGDDDITTTNVIMRHNTAYMLQSDFTSYAYEINSGSTNQFYNNIAYFGAGADNQHRCYQHTALSNYSIWDYNQCYHAGGNGSYSSTYSSLANAQAAGFDTNGLGTDPLFVEAPSSSNSWSAQIQSGSPAKNSGYLPSNPLKRDKLKCVRDAQPDRGAWEQGASSCPNIRVPIGVK